MINDISWKDTVEWVGVVAGCVIKQDDKYLLVQEKQPKVYGLWNLPAGYVDSGETIEQAAIRETREETGFDVKLGDQLGVYHESTGKPVKHAFEAYITSGKLLIQPEEILDVKWLSYEEVVSLNKEGKLRASWVFEAISKFEAK